MSQGIPTISTAVLHRSPIMMLKESASERRHIHWQKQVSGEEIKSCLRCPHCQMVTYNPGDIANNYCPACKIYHHDK